MPQLLSSIEVKSQSEFEVFHRLCAIWTLLKPKENGKYNNNDPQDLLLSEYSAKMF